jgi:hypothetical protein
MHLLDEFVVGKFGKDDLVVVGHNPTPGCRVPVAAFAADNDRSIIGT